MDQAYLRTYHEAVLRMSDKAWRNERASLLKRFDGEMFFRVSFFIPYVYVLLWSSYKYFLFLCRYYKLIFAILYFLHSLVTATTYHIWLLKRNTYCLQVNGGGVVLWGGYKNFTSSFDIFAVFSFYLHYYRRGVWKISPSHLYHWLESCVIHPLHWPPLSLHWFCKVPL